MSDGGSDEQQGFSRSALLLSAIGGLLVAIIAVWAANSLAVFHEELFRIQPTVELNGIGADWIEGNTIPWLDFLVALTHAADVIMGVFILVMVFIHWASFRRLAARMRQPGRDERETGVAADGGTATEAGGSTARERRERTGGGRK